jgi:mRNA-degrading endonuclease RelE of RelBE toxin-antitoxin system
VVNFCVLIDEDAQEFLDSLPKKSEKIIKTKLRILETDPFPGKGGDKELLNSPKITKKFIDCIFLDLIPLFIAPIPKKKL